MNGDDSMIERLAGSQMYQDYQRAYTEAMGLPLALRPIESWQVPLHGQRKENAFCALMAGKSRTCAACLQMQGKLGASAMREPATVTCANGLCELAVPVRMGERTIGFLQTGQVMRDKPTAAQATKVTRQVTELVPELNSGTVWDAYLRTPVVSAKKLDSISRLLTVFADHLSLKGNQIAIAQANAEPTAITRAKQFVNDHCGDDLSLGQVAATVHMSSFYFCKMFKKTTGMNFTEFVARARTEKARNLLLNPNLRISEIAYEVGFQSLTHFNRTFKRIVGQSPTEYRDQLPKAA